MPLFLTTEEYERCKHDPSLVAEKADAYIRDLCTQLETLRAQNDAASITAEQTCSLLEQKYVSLSSDHASLQSQLSALQSSLDQRLEEIKALRAEKQRVESQFVNKDGEIERLLAENSELHKSKRQLVELVEQKDLEIGEKNVCLKGYLDKIVGLTESGGLKEVRISELESELARCRAHEARFLQEKELFEKHNVWLNDELTVKVDSLILLRREKSDFEAEMSAKVSNFEKRLGESDMALKWNKERVRELETRAESLEDELLKSKGEATASEERFSAEISTVNKLADLYRESSEEWSKKAGELEGVIKALETHLSQVENNYKERLQKEVSLREGIEKEAVTLKEKLEACKKELERFKREDKLMLPLALTESEVSWLDAGETVEMVEDDRMIVPRIPGGVSGTALAASLLREGWSLAKMYAKYQEAVDALRHEQLGRKQSQDILERVLHEVEEKAGAILDEREEHERLVEAYDAVNEKLQQSLSEQSILERTIQELKADLRRRERDSTLYHRENADLQKQVAVLLKECRDIQLRCGTAVCDYGDEPVKAPAVALVAVDSDTEKVISERLLTFKDISGLVEQNAQLRSLVRNLSDHIENRELDLKDKYEKELQKHRDEAALKVNEVLEKAEEQSRMIESLHTSVAMYKKLYGEEHKLHSSKQAQEAESGKGRRDVVMLLPERSHEVSVEAREQSLERVRCLEEDIMKLKGDLISTRSERDKLAMETHFAKEKLDRFMKEFEHQREEQNAVLARNVEFSQLIIDYQRKLRESSDSVSATEELSRKLNMEVSVLKCEKEILQNSEKRASDEVRSLSERVHRLQASLDTIQSTEEIREEARAVEKRRQEEYSRHIEKEWADAKKQLHEERDNVRSLTLERENAMKSAMKQVEDLGKELANALKAIAAAESRAAVSEARCADLEKMLKSSHSMASGRDDAAGSLSSGYDEITKELQTAKDEIAKLKEEAQVNRDHMLQYKSIAQVSEEALKQMEQSYESFKADMTNVKNSYESEVALLRERINELETECALKAKETASATQGKEEALAAALSEIASLKEDSSVKISQIAVLETQVSALRDDLESEHKKWRAAQDNYERQVILQSETIQELTKTSQALAVSQREAFEMRNLVDTLKAENCELKVKWEAEKLTLEALQSESDRKYNELDEQNKILHSRVEALHIKLAENDRSGSSKLGDEDGLQNVVNYLRHSKEIAETEISLLRQERLRLQSQLENALKASESAQASLQAERANSRTTLFTEQEFKSLQLQVREINLLRESNVQLREENRYNFEECLKLREAAQKTRIEAENLQKLLQKQQNEVEACRKDIDRQNAEKEHLQKTVNELLERYKNFDLEDYDRTKKAFEQMQINMTEKDAQIEEIQKLASAKQALVSQLEQDLARSKLELREREARINDVLQAEASLKSEIEKLRRLVDHSKKRIENLNKEKEELSKENQALSRQLEDSRQAKKSSVDAAGDQAMKEKEERDVRIQILEKTVERCREDLRKEKDEQKMERVKRQKIQRTIAESYDTVSREKSKLLHELEKHKEALKSLQDEVEKLRQVEGRQSVGESTAELLTGTQLEDVTASYVQAVEKFGQVAQPFCSELKAAAATATATDASSAMDTGESVSQAVSLTAHTSPVANPQAPKSDVEGKKEPALPKVNVLNRRTGRKLVRPRIIKPEEPQVDVDMPDSEGTDGKGKLMASHNVETQENITASVPPAPPSVQKRPLASDVQEESISQETDLDPMQPLLKKSKGPEATEEGRDENSATTLEVPEVPEVLPSSEEYDIGDPTTGSKEELLDAERDEVDSAGEHADEPTEDATTQSEFQMERSNVDEPSEAAFTDDVSQQEIQQLATETGSDREEGELVADIADHERAGSMSPMMGSPEIGGDQAEQTAAATDDLIGIDEDSPAPPTTDAGEVETSQAPDNEQNNKGDTTEVTGGTSGKVNDGNNQAAAETDLVQEASGAGPVADPVAPRSASASGSGSSTTINLQERARQRASMRRAGLLSPSLNRGRARGPRGRGGRAGRGQAGDQG